MSPRSRIVEPPPEPARAGWEERLFAQPSRPGEASDRWFAPDRLAGEEPERIDPGWTPSWERRSEEPKTPGRHTQPSGAFAVPTEPSPSGGRRRRAETQAPARKHARPEESESGGRRRRRAEGSGPAWQEAAAWQPEPEPGSGSHATGNSVADLLAAHGSDKPRRRRRRED